MNKETSFHRPAAAARRLIGLAAACLVLSGSCSLSALAADAPVTAASAPAAAVDMELELSGIASSEGQILVSVFASPEDWLKKPVAVASAPASAQKDGRLVIKLAALPLGRLALNVAHDLNGNGRLDMNAMRLPIEPFAFSNNATSMFGPPKFEAALFEVKAGARLSVSLK
ncbi:MAG: hypothetical protein CFE41_13470 [Burkholderiales bacterium PBB2]|nr:MAG: hypothetical protein CFE41_13470 [Burkholderiales bacterium PBB2]